MKYFLNFVWENRSFTENIKRETLANSDILKKYN